MTAHASTPHENPQATYLAWTWLILLAAASMLLAELDFIKQFAISPLIIAVLLGAFFSNVMTKATAIFSQTKVLALSTKQILRLGIILYGFRLSFVDIAQVGVGGVLLAFVIVFSTFFMGLLLGRLLGIDGKSAVLISAGSSICGAAAVLATESVIKGGSARVGIAVCTVVVFGTLSMLTYPILYRLGLFDLSLEQMGYLMGASLHEVAHAVGAGSALGGSASDVTVIIKMLRVLMLVPFLLMLGLMSTWFVQGANTGTLRQNIPYFALWFLVAVCVSSLLPTDFREAAMPWLIHIDNFLLSLAMGALGLTMKKAIFTNAGFKPFVLATGLLVWLVSVAYLMVSYGLPLLS